MGGENRVTSGDLAISLQTMPPERACGQSRLPAPRPSVAGLRRIAPYLRPYLPQLTIMLAAALVTVAAQLTIPLLAKWVIDGAIVHDRRGLLIPLSLAAIGLALAEAAGMLIRRTALIIAHRLSTVEIADRVLVLDRGRVMQDGPPARLLADEGRFARMHQSWRASQV